MGREDGQSGQDSIQPSNSLQKTAGYIPWVLRAPVVESASCFVGCYYPHIIVNAQDSAHISIPIHPPKSRSPKEPIHRGFNRYLLRALFGNTPCLLEPGNHSLRTGPRTLDRLWHLLASSYESELHKKNPIFFKLNY
ncbi:hypothetical protein GE061_018101 [Apolygus lucorum]|uniref:Uncharacterized protein n=1 Tax=Apolygus lucorum TaxID=248454 RepID=A0A8S9XGY0_APOLU|nr:hypothetical protein GE061_018101 [Apolygus lucorum]